MNNMKPKERIISYREALVEAQTQEMERDSCVFAYGLDVCDHVRIFGSTAGLVEKFGKDRVFGTPLSEDALAGFGLGAAINGLRPINIHIRVDFLALALNQIVNMISAYHYMSGGKAKVPLVFRALIGRGWGQGMQHSKSLQAIFAHIPGLKVVMPTRPADAKGLLISAIRDDNPVIMLEQRWLYDTSGPVEPDVEKAIIPLGKGNIIRKGKDVTIVATSWMNIEALKAAEVLEKKHGVSAEIVDPRTIVPLDEEIILRSVEKTGHCVAADLDWLNCGFSAEVAARVQEKLFGKLKSPVSRLGFASVPCPTTRPLENIFYAGSGDIIRLIEKKLDLPEADLSEEQFYSHENKFKGPF
jgi:pyruvate dehydrogenase E1 component beta subunit